MTLNSADRPAFRAALTKLATGLTREIISFEINAITPLHTGCRSARTRRAPGFGRDDA